MGSCSSSHAWLLEGILFSLWSAILNGLSTDFHPEKKGMVITENERQSKLVCWKIPVEFDDVPSYLHLVWFPMGHFGPMGHPGLQCGHLEEHRTAPSGFWDAAYRGDVQFASSALPNAAEIAVSCWKDATVDSRFTSILIMVTFFWLHFCTWPRRSLHRAPFVWELQWPHFEIPTPQYPVQNGVQREKMWRGAGLEWLMLLKNSQQRVIARHGTEKFPLRFPIDYKHFIRI